jgi:hypothetical protein
MAQNVLAAIGAALLLIGPTLAAEAPGPMSDPATIHLHNYGDRDRNCLRWSDGCRACSRDAGGSQVCSNIGPACQPAEIKCTERQDGDAKK